MHQSFTGNTRKTRQVNLSGRNASHPWASLSKSGPGSASPSQNPVAQAQAERAKRQQERERLTAARRIQKLWRGHSSRRKQKGRWRRIWDENEQRRLGLSGPLDYEALLDPRKEIPAYQDPVQLLSQLRLVLQFQEFYGQSARDRSDTLRVAYFGAALQQTTSMLLDVDLDDVWRHSLARLIVLVIRHLHSLAISGPDLLRTRTSHAPRFLKTITFLCGVIPEETASNASELFDVMVGVIQLSGKVSWRYCTAETIVAVLTSTRNHKQPAYFAFARNILGQDAFSSDLDVLKHLAGALNLSDLSIAIKKELEDPNGDKMENMSKTRALWQLAHLIYMHDSVQKDYDGQNSYIEAISALLGHCADQVAARFDLEDQPMFGTRHSDPFAHQPLPTFVREQVSQIPRQENVRAVLQEMDTNKASRSHDEGQDFESAKRLADFAVALLRAFPSKAQDIRMALYQGSVRSLEDTDMSTIQYFWSSARTTSVFKKATQNYRNVLSLLKEAAPETNQIGHPSLTQDEIALWRDEWRIVLLFLELYTFVLKFMDDDDFFALDSSKAFGMAPVATANFISRRGALPLEDVALMTTFLKNLAFTLYWHAVDLVESNEVEEEANLAALFGGSPQPPSRSSDKKQQTLTGNGVSQGYLKGLVTGLLRMLHERDSRRSFVPTNHWLMTNQVNMSGFISAVVSEEERRHELDDENDGDEQEDDFDKPHEMDMSTGSGASDALLSTMFGIRQPHMPRSRASRQAERLERQRLQARKKRQFESLAPRLEILRNLPFFIPFETRVQIFREFVHRDQIRRRDGAVDPDSWRMSIATTTQGRGPDGRPRGLDIISRHHAEIRRESVFADAYDAFYPLGEGLKEPIQITFIDKFGTPEAGIDGGGVTKEFLMSVTSEAFDPDATLSMFKENAQRYLYPNPLIFQETGEYLKREGRKPGTNGFEIPMAEFLRHFQFLGRVVGKCMYEGILIDVNFAGFFLLKWALTGGTTVGSNESAYRATINDVREYDEELYHGLLKLKNYPGDVETDFALDFTITDTLSIANDDGADTTLTTTTDLMPNGSKTPVTNTNRLLYIDRIVRYKLQQQPKAVTDAFLKGLGQIVQPMWLAMFNQKELQKLVGGDNSELDIADLRRNTQYGGVYTIGDDGVEHPTVQLFWKALQDMDDGDRRKVLKFVTSTPRAPLLGFSHLNPKFSIRDSSDNQERLPSTSTCVNLLKLPRYGDMKTLREKLLYAVHSGAGFDLS